MKVSYNWLKWYVPDMPDAEKVADAVIFHAFEVESVDPHGDDFILEIKTLPDRNHDCLSHMGIAKEISAILDIPYNDPTPQYKIPTTVPATVSIDIQTQACRRYMGRVVRGIKVGPSPEWVVKHLESIGQRSINNIVDATNLTMFNCGQPVHALDLGKMQGGIMVRDANAGEKITLLTGEEKELNDSMAIISDSTGNALAVAGVKGGKFAEVDTATTDIFLEVANFDPVSVRKTAKALNIQTDSTKRFENDLSPELASYAMRELSALLFEMFPDAVFEEIIDLYPNPQQPWTVMVDAEYINKQLGTDFSVDEIENVWKRLKFAYTKEGNTFTVTPPALRLDLTAKHDFVEEVGRIMGYDRVQAILPGKIFESKINEVFYKTLAVKKHFIDLGYSEVMTYTFRNKGHVELSKTASDKKFLRTNLKDGMEESLKSNTLNAPFLGIDTVKIFEIGTVFDKDGEHMHVAFNEKKQIMEMTLDEFCIKNNIAVGDSYDGLLGENTEESQKFVPWSVYPFMTRDVAVWTNGGEDKEKLYAILTGADLLISEPRLVDEFSKDGRTSYAYRLVFQSYGQTLTDEEIGKIMDGIYAKIAENKDWEVR
ncbi:MAG: phenylalanine--tRNA ligase subunit beta [Candidatus Pacebacteria bacterium]|nr:phenylalanine--tRNA ligase subunit beta [Candidatus Paceibacterota bacterium]